MPPLESSLVYIARPTLRLEGEDHERLSSLLTSMVMSEQEGGLSSLELRLSNSASLDDGSAEYAFDAGGELDLGKSLVIGAGDSSSPIEIFRGRVSGIEGVFSAEAPPELIVLAEDALQRLRLKRRTRTFEEQSLADIARAIAGDHGLSPEVDGLDEQFGTQVQLNETDLGFLRRLLARVDADVQVVGTALQISRRSDVRRGEIELTLGEELKSARILADLAHQVTTATTKGWDVAAGRAIKASGSDSALGPGAGRHGSSVLQDAFGDRQHHSGHLFSINARETEALATTVRNRRARRFLRIQGITTGTPLLRVGSHVRVNRVSAWFSNTYYVTSVRHLFDPIQGYRTEFDGQCAFLGPG